MKAMRAMAIRSAHAALFLQDFISCAHMINICYTVYEAERKCQLVQYL